MKEWRGSYRTILHFLGFISIMRMIQNTIFFHVLFWNARGCDTMLPRQHLQKIGERYQQCNIDNKQSRYSLTVSQNFIYLTELHQDNKLQSTNFMDSPCIVNSFLLLKLLLYNLLFYGIFFVEPACGSSIQQSLLDLSVCPSACQCVISPRFYDLIILGRFMALCLFYM